MGYHDSVAGPLDRDVLDAVAPAVPLRVQHRSGVLWILNSAGLARVGLAGHPDGRLRSADSWSDALSRSETNLADLSARLSRYGVTGITDATPDLDIADIVRLSRAAPARRTAPARALPGPGQTDPARRRPGPRAARRLDRRAAPRRSARSPSTASPPHNCW